MNKDEILDLLSLPFYRKNTPIVNWVQKLLSCSDVHIEYHDKSIRIYHMLDLESYISISYNEKRIQIDICIKPLLSMNFVLEKNILFDNFVLQEISTHVHPFWVEGLGTDLISNRTEECTKIVRLKSLIDTNYMNVLVQEEYHNHIPLDILFVLSFDTIKLIINQVIHKNKLISYNRLSSLVHLDHQVINNHQVCIESWKENDLSIHTELTQIEDSILGRLFTFLSTICAETNKPVYVISTFCLKKEDIPIEHTLQYQKRYFEITNNSNHITKGYSLIEKEGNYKSHTIRLSNSSFTDPKQKWLKEEIKNSISHILIPSSIELFPFQSTRSFQCNLRTSNLDYAHLSKDYNPIHISHIGSCIAGLLQPICHGMHVWLVVLSKMYEIFNIQILYNSKVLFLSPCYEYDILTVSYHSQQIDINRISIRLCVTRTDTSTKLIDAECTISTSNNLNESS